MSVRADLLSLLAAAGLGLAGCASISSPQGGPRDTTPPKLVRSVPADGARNARTQTVRLEFSEGVQLKELSKNLIITPTIPDDNKYKVREERTAVSLVFDKPLEANTTYSFNFGNSIVDITESLPAANAAVSFSTGAVLDSGAVRGTVRDLLSTQPVDAASVLLYPEADTAGLRRGKPYYLGRTDKAGAFSLRNLKAGRYRLYALLDKNQSNRYEDGEKIAYLPAPIVVGPRPDTVRLQLVRPDARRPIVTGQQAAPTQFKVSYNEGLAAASLAPLRGAARPELKEGTQVAEQGRAVVVFRTPTILEGRYLLTVADSAGNRGTDTVSVRFSGEPVARRAALVTTDVTPAKEVYRQGQLQVKFSERVQLIWPKQAFATLRDDSTATPRPLRVPADGTFNADYTQLTINLNTKAKQFVTLQLDTSNVVPVSGQALAARPIRLRVSDQATTGSLAGTIQTKYTRYEVQLLDDKGKVANTLSSPRNAFRFDRIAPGTYSIRVLIDADGDGRWRAADPKLVLLPEPVYRLPQPIQVRANWEIEDLRLAF